MRSLFKFFIERTKAAVDKLVQWVGFCFKFIGETIDSGIALMLRKIIKKLETSYFAVIQSTTPSSKQYTPLSPTNNAEKSEEYLEALKWALDNRAKIKNIAITGPYGSGKSSVIQTFERQQSLNPDFKFLNISLATFKDSTKEESKDDSTDLLRLIELSILQQIFYHEKDHKVQATVLKGTTFTALAVP